MAAPAKPRYLLAISGGGAPFSIRVNDCPVLEESQGAHLQVTIDANPWLRNGLNVLTAVVDGASGRCTAELQCADADRPREPPVTVAAIEAPRVDEDQGPILKRNLSFAVSLPLMRWRWDRAKSAPFTARDRLICADEVFNLWSALDARDLTTVLDHLALKSDEMCVARYLEPEEREAEVKAQLEPLLTDDSGWDLEPLDPGDLAFEPCASGRMARARNSVTGVSPLMFVNRQDGLVASIELFLYRESALRWRVIR